MNPSLPIALIAPLTLHLAARFPERRALPTWGIVAFYCLTIGLAAMASLLAPPTREVALLALAAAGYAAFGAACFLLLRTIQVAQGADPRSAQRARLVLLSIFLAETPILLMPISPFISLFIPYEAALGAQVLLPIGMAYAILRRDVLRIDAALRRTLDYAVASFGLLVVYFGLAALLTQFSRGLGAWGALATILSVVGAAAAFAPLHRLAQRLIDRALYPERLAFGRAIAAARSALAQVVRRNEVAALLEHTLPARLGAAWAQLVLRPSFAQPNAAGAPSVWTMLLVVGGQPLGAYWLGPRHSGAAYDADEQEQLRGLLQQAALALAYADTVDALTALNRELEERVATRSAHLLAQQRELAALEERQRLARDLHDSVKQTLFSLGLGLRAARGRLPTDPTGAAALLQQQEHAALQAQVEMGELLADLRAPADASADLVAALADHCARLAEEHGLRVALQAPPALVLPEPLPHELALVAREALHNVLRHSGTREARLSLATEGGRLDLVIDDGGCGFDSDTAPHGHGLRGIRERVAALGGELQVRAAPNKGTSVWVRIELDQSASSSPTTTR